MPSPPLDSCSATDDLRFARWLEALEARQLANLKFAEVTRALRALSSAYVERRREGAPRAALDSAGKRAAFALFYAPLHFIATRCVVSSLAAHLPAPRHVLDLGCGTGVGGAAWALSAEPTPTVSGIDRHPWAVEETRWTYSQLGLRGRASAGSLPSQMRLGPHDAAIAAYVLNELPQAAREKVEATFVRLAETGTRILVIEPISRAAVPWWETTVGRLEPAGFHANEWRVEIERPPIVRKLDEASGLDHRTLRFRSLYHPGRK